ncbi:hypothetical protein MBLNU230_g4960t1 [Neophaeotheca triangularis]
MSIPSHASNNARNIERLSQKRKRDESENGEINETPFTIQPPSSDPFGRPLVLTPICLVSRTQLPLAYLDTTSSGGQLFSANIQPLDAAIDHGHDRCVLVAADEREGRLHAIEKAGQRKYALCMLRTWVREDDLVNRASRTGHVEERPVKRLGREQKPGIAQPWWAICATDPPAGAEDGIEGSKQPKLTMLIPETVLEQSRQDAALPHGNGAVASAPDEATLHYDDNMTTIPTETVLRELGKQYLDALYTSKASLAFFAKGPLARARACLASELASAERLGELIGFLKEAIMPVSVMEKKYRDAVPTFIEDLPLRPESETEKPKAKKKRKWKAKRDKTGMLHNEKEYIETWWRADEGVMPVMSTTEGRESAVRRRMPQVRSRETYLQIVLILEVFALETMAKSRSAHEIRDSCQTVVEANNDGKPKAKKPLDLDTTLDSQLDKLCIWQSLEAISPLKQSKDGSGQEENDLDELKRFCVEVILPFYMSRAPKHATSVNKKLGGPAPAATAKQLTSTSRRPGEPAVRQPPEKRFRKSLHRTATETLPPNLRAPPSLQRSATDSRMLEPIKRESSEVALDSIPAAKPRPGPRQRPSVLHTLTANRREVDLSAKSQANARRVKQKAEAEQKKEEAIAALRKPNRGLATLETAENADRSFARATAKNKPAQPPRKRASEMVTATPARPKAPPPPNFSNVASTASMVPATSARYYDHPQAAVPGSAVPQSSRKPQYGVEETPSRGFAKYMPQALARAPGTLESPVAQRKNSNVAIMATPSKPTKTFTLPQTPIRKPSLPTEALTPLRQTPAKTQGGAVEAAGDSDMTPEPLGEPKSVYAAFGWEDEYEELA